MKTLKTARHNMRAFHNSAGWELFADRILDANRIGMPL